MGGVHQNPVTFLISQLAACYAPLGEETRLTAMTELMQFRRNSGEPTDSLITRFQGIRHRAEVGGANMMMSVEGISWLFLRACGVNSSQLLTLLQPTNTRFPTSEAEFQAMLMAIRRMGHILEGAVGNIASQLRTPPTASFPAFEVTGEPQQSSSDPW